MSVKLFIISYARYILYCTPRVTLKYLLKEEDNEIESFVAKIYKAILEGLDYLLSFVFRYVSSYA